MAGQRKMIEGTGGVLYKRCILEAKSLKVRGLLKDH